MAKDPMCGMTVDQSSPLRAERNGRTNSLYQGPSSDLLMQSFTFSAHRAIANIVVVTPARYIRAKSTSASGRPKMFALTAREKSMPD